MYDEEQFDHGLTQNGKGAHLAHCGSVHDREQNCWFAQDCTVAQIQVVVCQISHVHVCPQVMFRAEFNQRINYLVTINASGEIGRTQKSGFSDGKERTCARLCDFPTHSGSRPTLNESFLRGRCSHHIFHHLIDPRMFGKPRIPCNDSASSSHLDWFA